MVVKSPFYSIRRYKNPTVISGRIYDLWLLLSRFGRNRGNMFCRETKATIPAAQTQTNDLMLFLGLIL